MKYEKYRCEYDYEQGRISLDEMPYGDFIEIEADNVDQIKRICQSLNLEWNKRVQFSYIEIFNLIREMDKFDVSDLTFEAFQKWSGDLTRLGIFPADSSPVK